MFSSAHLHWLRSTEVLVGSELLCFPLRVCIGGAVVGSELLWFSSARRLHLGVPSCEEIMHGHPRHCRDEVRVFQILWTREFRRHLLIGDVEALHGWSEDGRDWFWPRVAGCRLLSRFPQEVCLFSPYWGQADGTDGCSQLRCKRRRGCQGVRSVWLCAVQVETNRPAPLETWNLQRRGAHLEWVQRYSSNGTRQRTGDELPVACSPSWGPST